MTIAAAAKGVPMIAVAVVYRQVVVSGSDLWQNRSRSLRLTVGASEEGSGYRYVMKQVGSIRLEAPDSFWEGMARSVRPVPWNA